MALEALRAVARPWLARWRRARLHRRLPPHVTAGFFCDLDPTVEFIVSDDPQPIVIGDGAWLGAGVIVLPGRRIGRGAVVGAGSVVTKDIPPDTVWAGNPARMLRELTPLRSYRPEVFGTGAHARFRPPPEAVPLAAERALPTPGRPGGGGD